jgi:hypothetical protein
MQKNSFRTIKQAMVSSIFLLAQSSAEKQSE